MLWRIEHGTLDFAPDEQPNICVLLVGTNNVKNTAEQVADAILTIVKTIRLKLPNAYILVLSLPPKGQLNNVYRENVYKINELVEKHMQSLACPLSIYLDCDSKRELVNKEDGSISRSDMIDYLHFSDAGYSKFCLPLSVEINRILGTMRRQD